MKITSTSKAEHGEDTRCDDCREPIGEESAFLINAQNDEELLEIEKFSNNTVGLLCEECRWRIFPTINTWV